MKFGWLNIAFLGSLSLNASNTAASPVRLGQIIFLDEDSARIACNYSEMAFAARKIAKN